MNQLRIILLFGMLFVASTSAQWEQVAFPNQIVRSVLVKDEYLFASVTGKVVRSSDGGISWDSVAAWDYIESFKVSMNSILASRSWIIAGDEHLKDPCLFKSDDNGITWDTLYSSEVGAYHLQAMDHHIFASFGQGLVHSDDQGKSWVRIDTSSIFKHEISDFDADKGKLFIVVPDSGFFVSQDYGKSWLQITTPFNDYDGASIKDSMIVLWDHSNNNIWISTDSGVNWKPINQGLPTKIYIPEIYILNNFLIANLGLGYDSAIYKLYLDSLIWKPFSEGLIFNKFDWIIQSCFNEQFIFTAATNGLWKRPLEQLTSIDESKKTIPYGIYLEQNYPNPFNPVTVISFQLSVISRIELCIYNIMGQKVRTLVSGQQTAGRHEVVWDGTDATGSPVASGIYFYRMKAGDFVQTKRMLLMR